MQRSRAIDRETKMRGICLVLAITTALSLGGCRKAHKVSVIQTSGMAPRVILYTPSSGLLNAETQGVEINQFAVLHRQDPNKSYDQIWVIKTKSEKPIMVKEITYGVVPPGFEESIPARPLVAGEVYEILSSMPGNIGGGAFQADKEWPVR